MCQEIVRNDNAEKIHKPKATKWIAVLFGFRKQGINFTKK
jgi:hypothetical protein